MRGSTVVSFHALMRNILSLNFFNLKFANFLTSDFSKLCSSMTTRGITVIQFGFRNIENLQNAGTSGVKLLWWFILTCSLNIENFFVVFSKLFFSNSTGRKATIRCPFKILPYGKFATQISHIILLSRNLCTCTFNFDKYSIF